MIKSLSIEKLFTDLPFYQRFAQVSRAGFGHLEFGNWPARDLERIRAEMAEHEVGVISIAGDREFNLIHPNDRHGYLEYLEQSAQVAVSLGCPHLVIHSNSLGDDGTANPRGNELSTYTRVAAATRTLSEAIPIAAKYKVTLQLEPVSTVVKPGYQMHTTPSAGDIIAVLAAPQLRLLYDVHHMQLMEGNIVQTLRRYADVLGYVQIGDVPERFEPGTGEINFARFKDVLFGELGYDGVVSFELYPATDIETCLEALRRF